MPAGRANSPYRAPQHGILPSFTFLIYNMFWMLHISSTSTCSPIILPVGIFFMGHSTSPPITRYHNLCFIGPLLYSFYFHNCILNVSLHPHLLLVIYSVGRFIYRQEKHWKGRGKQQRNKESGVCMVLTTQNHLFVLFFSASRVFSLACFSRSASHW